LGFVEGKGKFDEEEDGLFLRCVDSVVFGINFGSKCTLSNSKYQDCKLQLLYWLIRGSGCVGEVQNIGANTVNPVLLTGSVYSAGGVDQADS